jgi:hypothetical protein
VLVKQPFKLPDFYMPYPARINPNLESARVHSKAWAYEMGILGSKKEARNSAVWDERDFDAHDYALLCAYTHPDAPGPELDLLTDWYVWVFFFDDDFLELFKRTKDMEGAKDYLIRLRLFMPIEQGGAPAVPKNPVERALQDLWNRTIPSKSKSGAFASLRAREICLRSACGSWRTFRKIASQIPSSTSRCGARLVAHPGLRTWSSMQLAWSYHRGRNAASDARSKGYIF